MWFYLKLLSACKLALRFALVLLCEIKYKRPHPACTCVPWREQRECHCEPAHEREGTRSQVGQAASHGGWASRDHHEREIPRSQPLNSHVHRLVGSSH
eukprot:3228113-Rhodomonas_salina.2